jgi:hypothetical protein
MGGNCSNRSARLKVGIVQGEILVEEEERVGTESRWAGFHRVSEVSRCLGMWSDGMTKRDVAIVTEMKESIYLQAPGVGRKIQCQIRYHES